MDVVRYRSRSKPKAPQKRKRKPWIAAIAGLVTLLLLLAVLARGLGRPAGQAAATLNGSDITLQDVAAEARAEGRSLQPSASPALLDAVVARKLFSDEAQRRGLQRSRDYPSDRRRAEQQTLVDLLVRSLPPPAAPTQAQALQFVADHPDAFDQRRRFTLEQLRFATSSAPGVSELSIDDARATLQLSGGRFAESQLVVIGCDMPAPIRTALSHAAEGETFAAQLEGATTLFQVLSVEPAAISGPAALAGARAALTRDLQKRQLAELLTSLRRRAKLRVSPGAGTVVPASGVRH